MYKSGSRPIHLAALHWLSDKLANSINKFCWVPLSTHWQESIIASTRQFLYSEEITGSSNMLACQITVLFLFEFLTFRILMPKYGKSCLKILFSFLKKTGQKCHVFCFCLARKVRGLIQSGDCFVFFVQPQEAQEAPFLNWGRICNLLSLHHATLSLFLSQAPTLTHSQTSKCKKTLR